jgi:hypothetical protein
MTSAAPLLAAAAGISAGRPSGPAAAMVCASLAYSFLPRPDDRGSQDEPITGGPFLLYAAYDDDPRRGEERCQAKPNRVANGDLADAHLWTTLEPGH